MNIAFYLRFLKTIMLLYLLPRKYFSRRIIEGYDELTAKSQRREEADGFSKINEEELGEYMAKVFDDANRYSPSKTLLDYGCGTGRYLEYFQTRGWNVYGVEIVESTIEKYTARVIDRSHLFSVDFAQARQKDIEPFAQLGISTIIAIGVVQNIVFDRELKRLFENFYSVLSRGGVVILFFAYNPGGIFEKYQSLFYRRYRVSDIKKLFEGKFYVAKEELIAKSNSYYMVCIKK